VLSYRLIDHNKRKATLNFYSETPRAFDTEAIEVGQVFGACTSVVWNALLREEQFRGAIANRDVIGQAKGMIMERFKIDAAAAFDLLRKLSQQSNEKVIDIARQLITIDGKSPKSPKSAKSTESQSASEESAPTSAT
jgi:hypothetical protein